MLSGDGWTDVAELLADALQGLGQLLLGDPRILEQHAGKVKLHRANNAEEAIWLGEMP